MAVRLSLNLANVAQSGQEIIFVTFSNSGKCLNSFWVYLIAPCCDDVSSVESTEVCLTGLVKKLSGHESTPISSSACSRRTQQHSALPAPLAFECNDHNVLTRLRPSYQNVTQARWEVIITTANRQREQQTTTTTNTTTHRDDGIWADKDVRRQQRKQS